MFATHQARRGFTLVELLVVIAIIGTLAALLFPALSRARDASRATASINNLSTFGRAIRIYADENKEGVLSSGAFDHFRDGSVIEKGWVADAINSKVANPGRGLDPSHPSKIAETVGDYSGAVGTNSTAANFNADAWGSTSLGSSTGSTYFDGSSPTRPVGMTVWDEGYNTNYSTTWHFSRGDPIVSEFGTGLAVSDGTGPLRESGIVNTSPVRVALMGPGRPGPKLTSGEASALNTFLGEKVAKTNDPMAKGMTSGMTVAASGLTGASQAAAGGSSAFVHTLDAIFPLHQPKAGGVGGFAPVLFADLHVDKVVDTTGDGYIGAGSTGAIDDAQYSEASEQIWIKRLAPFN